MSKEAIEKIDTLLDEANENIKFSQNYLKTGKFDFEKAPKTIKETYGIINAVITGVAVSRGIGAVATGLSIGAGTLATGALSLTTLGGALFTPLLSIATPVLLGSFIKSAVVKKHLNEKKTQIEKTKTELNDCINCISKDYNENNNKAKTNLENYHKKIINVINEFEQKAKETGKKAAIIIDDATHVDVNKRITQYQEIVLKQYEHQNELDKKLYDVAILYQKVLEENKVFIDKNNELMAILQSLDKNRSDLESLLNA